MMESWAEPGDESSCSYYGCSECSIRPGGHAPVMLIVCHIPAGKVLCLVDKSA